MTLLYVGLVFIFVLLWHTKKLLFGKNKKKFMKIHYTENKFRKALNGTIKLIISWPHWSTSVYKNGKRTIAERVPKRNSILILELFSLSLCDYKQFYVVWLCTSLPYIRINFCALSLHKVIYFLAGPQPTDIFGCCGKMIAACCCTALVIKVFASCFFPLNMILKFPLGSLPCCPLVSRLFGCIYCKQSCFSVEMWIH